MEQYYVYILVSDRNGTIYVGVTQYLARRVEEHKKHIYPGFTSKYGITKLVWYQVFADIREAIATEKRLKRWKRVWKLQLIDSFNHEWLDLSLPADDD